MAKKAKSSPNRLVGAQPCTIDAAQEKRWRAEEDVRTLQRAGEIKSDSDRLKTAKALAVKLANDLKKVCK